MATSKTKPKRAPRPKPPVIVRLAYDVERDVVVELGGKRHIFYAVGRDGLRSKRPHLVDAETWAKLQKDKTIQSLVELGQLKAVG